MKKRNEVIDVARGIGLFFVVLGHIVSGDSIMFKWIFSFHMPLFFFLSGMCFNYEKYNSFYDFFKEKFKKRIIPYLGFVLLGISISLIMPTWRIQLSQVDALTVLQEITYYSQPELIHIGQIWFLVGLFSAEIILYTLNKFFDKFNRNKVLIIATYLILALIGSKILIIINAIGLQRLPFKIDTAIIASIFMSLGYQANKNKIFEKLEKYHIYYILIFLCLGFLTGEINGYVNICNCSYNNIMLYFISALFGIGAIYLISKIFEKNEVIKYYGKNSLFMFAIHSFFISIFTYIASIFYKTEFKALINVPFGLSIMRKYYSLYSIVSNNQDI